MNLAKLAPFGVEIQGIDLRGKQDEATQQFLRDACEEHALLLFRDQDLGKADLQRIAGIFGRPDDEDEAPGGFNHLSNLHPPGEFVAEGERNLRNGYVGKLDFHCDHCFDEIPIKALMLYAVQVPPEGCGGSTLFADMRAATRMLPEELKKKLAGLTVLHKGNRQPGQPESIHPMLWKHPTTGVPILFFSAQHARRITELSPEESDALIRELPSYVDRPEIVLDHAWRPNDLIVWDNISLQHARSDFDPKYPRHLMRMQIALDEVSYA
jgi:alpha-ketoglutarate-dependent taurine dioxygenase